MEINNEHRGSGMRRRLIEETLEREGVREIYAKKIIDLRRRIAEVIGKRYGQRRLSEEADMPQSTVNRWENRKASPRLDHLVAIQRVAYKYSLEFTMDPIFD